MNPNSDNDADQNVRWGEQIVVYDTKAEHLTTSALRVVLDHGLRVSDVPPPPADLSESQLITFYEVVCWLLVRKKFEPVDVRLCTIYAKSLDLYHRIIDATVDGDGMIDASAVKLLPAVMNSVRAMALNLGIGPTTRGRWMVKSDMDNAKNNAPADPALAAAAAVWSGLKRPGA